MRKILVVEDEDAIREVVALNLRLAGYEVTEAASAEQALAVFSPSAGFDVAVLDIMLPGVNGFSLCETIRRDSASIGIIMLSAKTLETDKIKGLSIGADDYMTKPFSVSELLARVEALVRRVGRQGASSAAPEPDGRMVSGVFVLDQKSRVLYKNGTPIDLTQVEFQIMELFFANPGVALVREKILEGVWGENYFGDVKIVDVNIRRLRMKIEDEPSAPRAYPDGVGLRLPLEQLTARVRPVRPGACRHGRHRKGGRPREQHHPALGARQPACSPLLRCASWRRPCSCIITITNYYDGAAGGL